MRAACTPLHMCRHDVSIRSSSTTPPPPSPPAALDDDDDDDDDTPVHCARLPGARRIMRRCSSMVAPTTRSATSFAAAVTAAMVLELGATANCVRTPPPASLAPDDMPASDAAENAEPYRGPNAGSVRKVKAPPVAGEIP